MNAFCYKMIIAYDGTNYCGFQVQPNGITIQQVIQDKMQIILRKQVSIRGSGRTDAGVHAEFQVAHFHFSKKLDIERFHYSLNGLLPKDIRIKSIEEAPLSFHAQYSAITKTYHYHLHLDKIADPHHYNYHWHIYEKLDLQELKRAAKLFIGTHDFTSFANEPCRGSAAKDAVRTLLRIDLVEQKGGIRLEFEADGFLYKMVRNIVGFLVEVAKGKRSASEIPAILAAKDRTKAGPAAMPQGLFLMEVQYLLEK